MKKSNLVKLFSILLISVMVMVFSTKVLAADESNGFNQLTLNSNSSNSSTNNTNTNSTGNTNNTSNSSNTNNTNNTNTNKNNTTNTNNTKNNTNNSSVYNNTNLPKTGLEDSVPVAMLVVVFGISAVYAYKKIKDYRNI